MSLYLITKDVRLRALVNRSFSTPVSAAISMEQLEKILSIASNDPSPIIIIDADTAFIPLEKLLSLFVMEEIRGLKIFLIPRMKMHPHCTDGIMRDCNALFVSKPVTMDKLIDAIIEFGGLHILSKHLVKETIDSYLEQRTDPFSSILVGTSRTIQTIRATIRRLGPHFNCVHINGETGTGKEIVAQLLYLHSGCPKAMVIINCASLKGSLQQSLLFGHIKGAFTDAKEPRQGLLAQAHNGILFLDEIELLEHESQGQLLRLLETGKFRPIGSDYTINSHFKLITASNIPLEVLVESGKLRKDFYNRIDQFTIEIPPLRDRIEDIPLLINHRLEQLSEKRKLDNRTFELMLSYPWPGNVRGLFHELDTIVFFSKGLETLSCNAVLTMSHLRRNGKSTFLKNQRKVSEAYPSYSCTEMQEPCGKPVD